MMTKREVRYWLGQLDNIGLFIFGMFLGGVIENIGIKSLSLFISVFLLIILFVIWMLLKNKLKQKDKKPRPKLCKACGQEIK